jgi:hypothetical protein
MAVCFSFQNIVQAGAVRSVVCVVCVVCAVYWGAVCGVWCVWCARCVGVLYVVCGAWCVGCVVRDAWCVVHGVWGARVLSLSGVGRVQGAVELCPGYANDTNSSASCDPPPPPAAFPWCPLTSLGRSCCFIAATEATLS